MLRASPYGCAKGPGRPPGFLSHSNSCNFQRQGSLHSRPTTSGTWGPWKTQYDQSCVRLCAWAHTWVYLHVLITLVCWENGGFSNWDCFLSPSSHPHLWSWLSSPPSWERRGEKQMMQRIDNRKLQSKRYELSRDGTQLNPFDTDQKHTASLSSSLSLPLVTRADLGLKSCWLHLPKERSLLKLRINHRQWFFLGHICSAQMWK